MGFNFGFFGTPQHRQFNYKPVYYDPEKEARQERIRRAQELAAAEGKTLDESQVEKEKPYVPGMYVKGSLTDRAYRVERGASKAQKIIGAVTLVLAFAVIYLIGKFYPLIWQ